MAVPTLSGLPKPLNERKEREKMGRDKKGWVVKERQSWKESSQVEDELQVKLQSMKRAKIKIKCSQISILRLKTPLDSIQCLKFAHLLKNTKLLKTRGNTQRSPSKTIKTTIIYSLHKNLIQNNDFLPAKNSCSASY